MSGSWMSRGLTTCSRLNHRTVLSVWTGAACSTRPTFTTPICPWSSQKRPGNTAPAVNYDSTERTHWMKQAPSRDVAHVKVFLDGNIQKMKLNCRKTLCVVRTVTDSLRKCKWQSGTFWVFLIIINNLLFSFNHNYPNFSPNQRR